MYKVGRIKETTILGKTVNVLSLLKDIKCTKLEEAAKLVEELNAECSTKGWFIMLPEGAEAE